MSKHKTPRKVKSVKFDSDIDSEKEVRDDFLDYESKMTGQPQRFGDTRAVITDLGDENIELNTNLYHKNGLVHKIVDKPASDATRNGWRLLIPEDPDKQEEMQKKLDSLKLKTVFHDALVLRGIGGGAYTHIGAYEPTLNADPAKPIDVHKLTDIAFVHTFGEANVKRIEVNDDPTSLDYMNESAVVVTQTTAGDTVDKNGNVISGQLKTKDITIDKSRYFHMTLDRLEGDQTGTSIITRCWDQIHTLDTALYSVGKILYAYDINVVYSDMMASGDTPSSQASFNYRQKQLKQGMGTDSVLLLNATEKFERLSTNVGGIDSLLQFAWQNLAAASDIPKSVLLGEQAGTLAGATQDVANYYDGIKAIQEDILRPQLEYIIKLLFWCTDVAGGSEDPDSVNWKLVFNPLWSEDDKTKSETLNNLGNFAGTMVDKGIYDIDEAKSFINGQANNNIDSMQNVKADSAEEFEKQFTPEQVAQYKRDLARAHENDSTD